MINKLLYYTSFGLIVIGLFIYVVLILVNRKNKISKSNGFDSIKDILSDYDRINIIEGNNSFSFYNIKRRVIKLSRRDYYGNDLSAISLSMIQAGISICNSKFISFCRKIIPTLKFLDLLFIISLFINYVSVNVSDAKLGIIIMAFVICLRYLYIGILTNSYNFINGNIDKFTAIKNDKKYKVINLINRIILCYKIHFIADMMITLRMVLIILSL